VRFPQSASFITAETENPYRIPVPLVVAWVEAGIRLRDRGNMLRIVSLTPPPVRMGSAERELALRPSRSGKFKKGGDM
jgi:hypothetical protein